MPLPLGINLLSVIDTVTCVMFFLQNSTTNCTVSNSTQISAAPQVDACVATIPTVERQKHIRRWFFVFLLLLALARRHRRKLLCGCQRCEPSKSDAMSTEARTPVPTISRQLRPTAIRTQRPASCTETLLLSYVLPQMKAACAEAQQVITTNVKVQARACQRSTICTRRQVDNFGAIKGPPTNRGCDLFCRLAESLPLSEKAGHTGGIKRLLHTH